MPDMKREYVVEKYVQGLGTSLIPDAWMSVHTTDDQDDAVQYAKEQQAANPANKYRVRQFWVESFAPAFKHVDHGTESQAVEVETVAVHCMDHQDQCLKVYASGVMPRCPLCRKSMVAVGSLELDDTVMDLT